MQEAAKVGDVSPTAARMTSVVSEGSKNQSRPLGGQKVYNVYGLRRMGGRRDHRHGNG